MIWLQRIHRQTYNREANDEHVWNSLETSLQQQDGCAEPLKLPLKLPLKPGWWLMMVNTWVMKPWLMMVDDGQ